MNRLREVIASQRQEYASARFGGDLGELVRADPQPRRVWGGVAIGLAIAATLLLALLPGGHAPSPAPTTEPIAKAHKRRPAPRLLQAAAHAVRVEQPTRQSKRRPLNPLQYLQTEPRVAAPVLANRESILPRKKSSKSRRRSFSSPSLALRSMKDGIRFGI